jgi:hypothetical protein
MLLVGSQGFATGIRDSPADISPPEIEQQFLSSNLAIPARPGRISAAACAEITNKM